LKTKEYLGNIDITGRIVLKCILEENVVNVGTKYNWLDIRATG
jgi:hypothetical protein